MIHVPSLWEQKLSIQHYLKVIEKLQQKATYSISQNRRKSDTVNFATFWPTIFKK